MLDEESSEENNSHHEKTNFLFEDDKEWIIDYVLDYRNYMQVPVKRDKSQMSWKKKYMKQI